MVSMAASTSNTSTITGPSDSESTPLIKTDEENGIPTSDRSSKQRWKTTNSINNNTSSTTLPSWSQAFAEVSPFLRPRDRRHAILSFLALFTVLLEKLITVLPPLAIRHAVDAISEFGSSDGSDDMRQRTANAVSMSILVYFLLRTLNAAISSLQSVCQRAVSLDAERRFASSLFAHLQTLGAAYHLERHAGELLQILSRGSDATSTIIDSLWFSLLPTFFEAAVVGTVFWKLLGIPSIAVSTVASVILFLFYTVIVTNTRLEQRRKVLDKSEAVGRIETETLANYETVVMFGREMKEVEEYDTVRKEYTIERVNMLGLFAWLQLGQQSIRLAGTCVGLWLAGRATVYGTSGGGDESLLSPGSFVVVQLYIQQLFQPLSFLGFTYRQLTEAFTDLEKAVKMLRSKPLVEDAPDAVEWDVALEQQQHQQHSLSGRPNKDVTARSSGDITFDNVSFRYKLSAHKKLGQPDITKGAPNKAGGGRGKGGRRGFGRKGLWGRARGNYGGNSWIKDAAQKEKDSSNHNEIEKVQVGGIENISFNIPSGKTAALVGPSGSGKTTIVRLILRMYDPDDGAVMVDKINVKSLLQQSLRTNIGVVAQDTVLFHASLRDNIIYGKEEATEEEIWEAVRISALEPLVKSLPDGLNTLVGERGMKLSGGERQRVGLARCIIKTPKLIVLDEATSALDSGTELQIQRNIFTPQTAAAVCKGRTTLMIAHRLSTARRADMILVLDKGKLVEQGTHEELLGLGAERGMYARMWRDQMEGDSLDELK